MMAGNEDSPRRKPVRKSVAGSSTASRSASSAARASSSPSLRARGSRASGRSSEITTGQTRSKRAASSKVPAGATAKKSTTKAGKGRKKTTWPTFPTLMKNIGLLILSSKLATVIVAIVLIGAVAGIWDTASNWGKAYGHVSVNGIDVGGMTEDEIVELLDRSYTLKSTQGSVTVYANQEAMDKSDEDLTDEALAAQVEDLSVEEADAATTSWTADVYSLGATLPYDEAAKEALDAGRGGLFKRLGVLVFGNDVEFELAFDEDALEAFASQIDRTVGEARIDASVEFVEGKAQPVEGRQGIMLDREDFAHRLSGALLGLSASEFVATPVAAPSRTTAEQAQAACDGIDRAISAGAAFSFEDNQLVVSPEQLADWTRIAVEKQDDGSYAIAAHIDEGTAIPAIVSGVHAKVTSEDVTVSMLKASDEIIVNTSGPGIIPEVAPAVDALQAALYGSDGTQWGSGKIADTQFEIESTNAPGALTFEQAVDLGILSVIGEYTTEFSNYEGTENRNHNIMTVADILDGTVVKAQGGRWSFNENSGDTTQDPPFASAGSIIDGEHVDSIGGGICQVATTIFNAVYEAGLPIIERHNHTEHMHSYPDGRDASVSYGDWDLVWENDMPSDIALRLSYTDHSVTAKLYSVYDGRTVTIEQGEWSYGETYSTKFEESEWLYQGQYYTQTAGEDASVITVTRTVLDATGEVLYDESMTSSYHPKDEVIVIGPGTDTKPLQHKSDDEEEGEE